MKGLLFLSRLAFICNVLFLLCLLIQRTYDFISIKELNSAIIILGWFLAPFINLAANIWYFSWLISRRLKPFPAWLAIINFFILTLQLLFQIILP